MEEEKEDFAPFFTWLDDPERTKLFDDIWDVLFPDGGNVIGGTGEISTLALAEEATEATEATTMADDESGGEPVAKRLRTSEWRKNVVTGQPFFDPGASKSKITSNYYCPGSDETTEPQTAPETYSESAGDSVSKFSKPEASSENRSVNIVDTFQLLLEDERFDLLQYIATDLWEDFPAYRGTTNKPPSLQDAECRTRWRSFKTPSALMEYLFNVRDKFPTMGVPKEVQEKFAKAVEQIPNDLSSCADCCLNYYYFPSDWFLRPCLHNPHLLVMAKMDGFPPWPAKVTAVDHRVAKYQCVFFDEPRSHASVKISSCSKITSNYSKTFRKKSGKQMKSYSKAIRELKEHVAHLQVFFPKSFKFAETETRCTRETSIRMCDPSELPPLQLKHDRGLGYGKRILIERQLFHSLVQVVIEPYKAEETQKKTDNPSREV